MRTAAGRMLSVPVAAIVHLSAEGWKCAVKTDEGAIFLRDGPLPPARVVGRGNRVDEQC